MDLLLKEMKPTKADLEKAKYKQNLHFMEVNKNYPHLEY
jgi:hypothetical protein